MKLNAVRAAMLPSDQEVRCTSRAIYGFTPLTSPYSLQKHLQVLGFLSFTGVPTGLMTGRSR